MSQSFLLCLSLAAVPLVLGQNKSLTGVSIPSNYTYHVPEPFQGNISTNFIDTHTSSDTVNDLLSRARKAYYIAYDDEFLQILGPEPTIELVPHSKKPVDYAYEAGVWVYDHNQIWFSESIDSIEPDGFRILNLDDMTITKPNVTISYGANLNGGYYYDGLVYFTSAGNVSAGLAPSVYSVDPVTLETHTVINSYFGVLIDSIDDVTWVKPNTSAGSTSCVHPGESNMFFTSVSFTAYSLYNLPMSPLPNAVWRYNPHLQSLTPAIPRSDILEPNGIALDPTGHYLYVTDTAGPTTHVGPAANSSGSQAIYRYTLDEDCNPTNKIMFGLTRSGISDGIHVDDSGRVWTAESDGIVVRTARGKEIGLFNAEVLLDETGTVIANFALAGNKLVVLAVDRIWILRLGQKLNSPARYHS